MILKKNLKNPEYLRKFNELYNITIALANCIFFNDEFVDNIDFRLELTTEGNKLYKHLKKYKPEYTDSLIYFAIFVDYHHDKLYFSIENVDEKNIYRFIKEWINSGYIKFPWIYDRELYDKYYEDFDTQHDELDFDETRKLLSNTSDGVFQIEDIVIGPLGILKSKERRRIFPKLELELWHCPDPSCPNFHPVRFSNSNENKIIDLLDEINYYNSDKLAFDVSEIIIRQRYGFYDFYSLAGLYELIGNTFNIQENRNLVSRLLKKEDIKHILPVEFKKSSPDDIVKILSKDQCINIIFLCDDKALFKHIEDLIIEKKIQIPNTEIRASHILRKFGHYNTFIQCNKLGLRVNSKGPKITNLKLKKLLKDIHSESPLREHLDWSLRKFDHNLNLDQKLDLYIDEENPFVIIKDNILNGSKQLEKASELLLGNFKAHNSIDEEKTLVEKIAWKLGYDIHIYPNFLTVFWHNLSAFKQDVLNSSIYNEGDKARIRSSAVNLFVSIEEILQQSLSFITWALLSDHYIDTKFSYIYENARGFMVDQLNNYEYTSGEFLKLDSAGKNTLFPLVHGFNALIKKSDEIINAANDYKRPSHEFPSFYEEDALKIFPFRHKKFVIDILSRDYFKLKENISIIPTEFGKGKIMDIRNRLQHQRDDFPIQDEILQAISSIEKSFSILENEGIYPVVFLYKKTNEDEYGRSKLIVQNYKNTEIQFFNPSQLRGLRLPSFYKPLVCLKSVMLGYTNQPAIFSYNEQSNYLNYWKNYPRKKYKDFV